jgi:peptide/nickel transport system permease protein
VKRGALAVLALVALVALAAPLLPHGPFAVRDAGGEIVPLAPPSRAHWLGTDDVGRDVAARLAYGARTSLALAAVALGLALAAGVAAGALATSRPLLRALVVGSCDVLGALPPLVLVIAAQGIIGRASFVGLAALIALPRAADFARVTRAECERALALPHAEAARALGASPSRLIVKHALPLAAPQLAVAAAATLATAVLAEAALGFLGLGVAPPTASWGELIVQAHRNQLAWWLALPAGIMVAAVALAASHLADRASTAHL